MIRPDQLVAYCDAREKRPLDLRPLRVEIATLDTGDYSLKGACKAGPGGISVERKNLDDLIAMVAAGRDRFERELDRLLGFGCRAVVVEATWKQLEAGGWRSKVTPAAAVGSVLGWMALGVPFLFVGDHETAGRCVSRLLYIHARRRFRELQEFGAAISETKEGENERSA